MKNFYAHLQRIFEKITFVFTAVISNSITFMLALIIVIFWLANRNILTSPINQTIGDVINSIIFLTLFIIQKAFNHFTASLHLKINELVFSTKTANNVVLNVETKTELEIIELQKKYNELVKQLKIEDDEINIIIAVEP